MEAVIVPVMGVLLIGGAASVLNYLTAAVTNGVDERPGLVVALMFSAAIVIAAWILSPTLAAAVRAGVCR